MAIPHRHFQYAQSGAVGTLRLYRQQYDGSNRHQTKDLFTIKYYNIPHMHDMTGFQRDLLYVIVGQEEPHGLALKDELEDYYEKEIHHGRLYPNLDTLVEKGLVEKGQQDRRTNYYKLTRRGQREIEARDEWETQYVDQ
jgi:PadR family transcriptional regulator PadR